MLWFYIPNSLCLVPCISVQRALVVSMNEDEINQLLNDHGFFKEEEPEPVPDSDDESKEEL